MGVNKLDIEFEDEDEIKAREEAESKRSSIPEDVELSFDVHEEEESDSSPSRTQGPSSPKVKSSQNSPKVTEQSSNIQQESFSAPQGFQQLPQRQVFVGPDYKLGDELKKVAASNQILAIEIEARVKVEVTQQLTRLIAEHHAKNKLIEHKINKILAGIGQKVPALKNEIIMVRKLLEEHATLGDISENNEEKKSPSGPEGSQVPQKKKNPNSTQSMEQRKRAAMAAKKKKAA